MMTINLYNVNYHFVTYSRKKETLHETPQMCASCGEGYSIVDGQGACLPTIPHAFTANFSVLLEIR